MESVPILYSTGCPKCAILKRKLEERGISYTESNDIEQMEALGIQSVPVLSISGEMLDFSKAIHWINTSDGR